jgi:hypothetical protein
MITNFLRYTITIACAAWICAARAQSDFPIVVSGEAHAMLDPCDCPANPGGGFAQRATLIDSCNARGALLLLDAGGFCGGGLYDDYTQGRAADSLRTLAALAAMGVMGYDAVAVGDDELQYHPQWLAEQAGRFKVPLVSANIRAFGRCVFDPYIVVLKNGRRFGITAVATQERLMPLDTTALVEEPVKAIRRIWDEMQRRTDIQIIISHCGEDATIALADSFPTCDILVNGHRKRSTAPVLMNKSASIFEFGFQGKQLSYALVKENRLSVSVDRDQWLSVRAGLRPASAVTRIMAPLRAVDASAAGAAYDLYIMSICPYGIPALSQLLDFVARAGPVRYSLYFIGTAADDGGLTSLHGQSEVADELLWLAVRNKYPGRWTEFLRLRSKPDATADRVIADMGLDRKALDAWAATDGRTELAMQYRRSERLNITASPTLMINNVRSERDISAERLARDFCGRGGALSAGGCDSLPACIDDSDCRQKGKEGRCAGAGRTRKCQYTEATKFTFTVVRATQALQHPEEQYIATTMELFPGAIIDTVAYDSKRGKEMIRLYSVDALPFCLFDRGVANAANFASIKEGVLESGDRYVFKPGAIKRTYHFLRPERKNELTLFVDPLFADAPAAISACVAAAAQRDSLRVLPVIFENPAPQQLAAEEKFRQEEALRWLVLRERYPFAFESYIADYARRPPFSYWFESVEQLKVPLKEFGVMVNADAAKLGDHWKLLQELDIREPVVLLVDNREVVPVANQADLRNMLARILR